MNTRQRPLGSDIPAYTNIDRSFPDITIGIRSSQKKPTWYLLKVGDHHPQRSLRTTDKMEALKRALDALSAYKEDPTGDWLGNQGVRKNNMSFKDVAEEWLARQEVGQDYKRDVIDKFLVPYFQDERNVTSMAMIDDLMIADYRLWRRSYWLVLAERLRGMSPGDQKRASRISLKQVESYAEPDANTLNREYPTLRQILIHAHKRGYMGKAPAPPEVPAEKAKANPRPAFLGGDFDKLMAEAEAWAKEADDEPTRWKRDLLCDWIYVNRWTGLRVPHEADLLAWGHVNLDIGLLHVHPDTKTGKREVPLDPHVVQRLRSMLLRRQAYATKTGQSFSLSEMVFALPDGMPFNGFATLFNKVVARCAFPTRPDEMPYSPYSLRHTYATFALADGKGYPWLEEVMGTSEKMLKTHYKQSTIEQNRRYLESVGKLGLNGRKPLVLIDEATLPANDPRRTRITVQR